MSNKQSWAALFSSPVLLRALKCRMTGEGAFWPTSPRLASSEEVLGLLWALSSFAACFVPLCRIHWTEISPSWLAAHSGQYETLSWVAVVKNAEMRDLHIAKNESMAHQRTYIFTQRFQSFITSTSIKVMRATFSSCFPGDMQLAGASLYRAYQTPLAVKQRDGRQTF